MNNLSVEPYVLTLREYNESRYTSCGILTGEEYRRERRKNKRKKSKGRK